MERRRAHSWSTVRWQNYFRRRAENPVERRGAAGAPAIAIAAEPWHCRKCGCTDYVDARRDGDFVCVRCARAHRVPTNNYYSSHAAPISRSAPYKRLAYWNSLWRRLCGMDPEIPRKYLERICHAVRQQWCVEERGFPPPTVITRCCRKLGEPYCRFQTKWRQVLYALGAPRPPDHLYTRGMRELPWWHRRLLPAFLEAQQRFQIVSFVSLPVAFSKMFPEIEPYLRLPRPNARTTWLWNLFIDLAHLDPSMRIPEPKQARITEWVAVSTISKSGG